MPSHSGFAIELAALGGPGLRLRVGSQGQVQGHAGAPSGKGLDEQTPPKILGALAHAR